MFLQLRYLSRNTAVPPGIGRKHMGIYLILPRRNFVVNQEAGSEWDQSFPCPLALLLRQTARKLWNCNVPGFVWQVEQVR